jgi:hypothetical protein
MALEDWNVTKNKFKSQCILYKRQGLHLHDLVAYQSTSDEVMSVCSSPLTVRTLPPLLYFFNLQYVKELCKFGCFELVFIVSKYTVLFPSFDIIFCGPAPYCPAVLLRLLIGSFTGLDQFC